MTSSHATARLIRTMQRQSVKSLHPRVVNFTLITLGLLWGAAVQGPLVATASVFGVDDRIAFDQISDQPWSAIGRIEVRPEVGMKRSNLPICTATVIGPDEILTNAHCVVKSGLAELISSNLVFKAGTKQR